MTGRKMTIVITGSHHTPAIELIKQLREDPLVDWQIEYIAQLFPRETHITNTIIKKLKIPFHHLDSGKYDRRWLPNTLTGIPTTFLAIFKAYQLLRHLKPDIVVSFGGYISVPVIFTSWLQRIPSITHEQTSTLSLATRINHAFVNKVALSFPVSRPDNKIVFTGNLLRSEIFKNTSKVFKKLEPKLRDYPLIYVTGGSQGSQQINDTIQTLIPKLNQKFTIIHSLGNTEYTNKPNINNYYPTNYVNLEDIGWVLNHAQIIISRSGANICQEIVTLRRNSILIPLPISQQNEQVLNAQWAQEALPNNTVIIKAHQLTESNLLSAIKSFGHTPPPLSIHPPQSNHRLLQLIHEIV